MLQNSRNPWDVGECQPETTKACHLLGPQPQAAARSDVAENTYLT